MTLADNIWWTALLSSIATLAAVGALFVLLANLGRLWPVPIAVLLLAVTANLVFWIADVPRQISSKLLTDKFSGERSESAGT